MINMGMQATVIISVYEQICKSQSPQPQDTVFIKGHTEAAHSQPLRESISVALSTFFSLGSRKNNPISTLSFLSIRLNIIFASQRLTTFWLQKTQGKTRPICLLTSICSICLSFDSKCCPVT